LGTEVRSLELVQVFRTPQRRTDGGGAARHQTCARAGSTVMAASQDFPSLDDIRVARERLGDRVRETPVWQWRGDAIERAAGARTQAFLKLELFQHTGTFKARGTAQRDGTAGG